MPLSLGWVFALISLATGIVFFVYAVRYYVSVVLVLLGGERVANLNNFNNHNNYNNNSKNWRNWRNHNHNNNHFNFERRGKREPFVSIHLPMYNERNVVDRILKACTSLDYKNYEVVVIDDSTDETIDILRKNWAGHPRVKVIHREERTGFKGGALNEALRRMDPKAEYVCVFDADFIPPPDIINRFLWYFENPNYNNYRSLNRNNNMNRNNPSPNGLGNQGSNREAEVLARVEEWYKRLETAAVQGYQWHWLNAGESWLTRGVRAEYSGNYMVERVGQELLGSMKMIAGSVFMVKADLLRRYGWSTSITEDWELTIRLYMDGYKVIYTPMIAAPAECPSTIRRLVRQRQRWAEGHTFNVKRYFWRVLRSAKLTGREKFEFIFHYSLYYLQSLLFCVGTFLWFLSEYMHTYLPHWTATFGWSLVLTNLLSLPLMGLAGLFLERSVKRDVIGVLSVVVLSYVLAPFQAYSSLKGLLEKEEGTWIRTFKTGKITEAIMSLRLRRIIRKILPKRRRGRGKAKGSSGKKEKKAGRKGSGKKLPGTAMILLILMSTMLGGITLMSWNVPGVGASVPPWWWNSDYQYRKQLTISTTPALLSDYPVNFTTDTTEAHFQDDGGDVRIVWQNSSDQSFHELDRVNSTNFNTASTNVWFKTKAAISADGSDDNYYMYYGSPTAVNPPTAFSKGDIAFVKDSVGGTTKADPAIKTRLENALYTVTEKGQTDQTWTPEDYDAVFASESCLSSNLAWLKAKNVGMMSSEQSIEEWGFAGGGATWSGTQINILDNTQFITKQYSTGLLTVFTSTTSGYYMSAGNDEVALANTGTSGQNVLIIIDSGGTLYDGTTAANRRVILLYGSETDWSTFNDDAWNLFDRSIEWIAHQDLEPLVSVGDETYVPEKVAPLLIIVLAIPIIVRRLGKNKHPRLAKIEDDGPKSLKTVLRDATKKIRSLSGG